MVKHVKQHTFFLTEDKDTDVIKTIHLLKYKVHAYAFAGSESK